MAKKRKQDKSFDIKAHMAKIRAMRGKGKRKGGKGSRMKKLSQEVKGLRQDLKGAVKMITQLHRKAGVSKPATRTKRRAPKRRRK